MKMLFLPLLLVGVILLFFVLKKRQAGLGDSGDWPFYAKKLLTQPEQVLFHRLVTALPECNILAQVQLSRVLGVKKGFNFNQWNNRINRMSLDYVVCLKDSSVVLAVELDDRTHENKLRKEADLKKEKALASAGVKLLRWNVNALPDELMIRQAIAG